MKKPSAFRVFREKYAGDIRFWIFFFFILRMVGITDPPLEIAHNWRQVTGHMVARNFYETDNNILYPRLDIAGEKSGITGTEFSVLNYLEYLLSLIFGFHDWFGRLINLIVSSFGIFYFYKLLRLHFSERFSFNAAFVLLVSSWFMFSRKAMPDTFSTSLIIISVYFAYRYCSEKKLSQALLYFFFSLCAVMSKIPAIYLLVVLAFPFLDRQVALRSKVVITLLTLLMLIPVYWWYFRWVPQLNEQFGFKHYFMGVSFSTGLSEILHHPSPTVEKFYFDALKFSGFLAFCAGLVLAIYKKERRILWPALLCSLAFAVFMLKSGRNFYHHSYYIVPFIPVMALFAGFALDHIQRPVVRTMMLLLITAECIGNHQNDFYIKKSEKYKMGMEAIADSFSKRKDLFLVNSTDNPQQMYLLHRRGWLASPETLGRAGFIDSIAGLGCRYLLINRHEGKAPSIDKFEGKEVYNDDNFVVYSLQH
ncbi:MAG: ArnT family glycosyltransferase [Bacteroidia bacterium]